MRQQQQMQARGQQMPAGTPYFPFNRPNTTTIRHYFTLFSFGQTPQYDDFILRHLYSVLLYFTPL